jgi:hypothetical protein
MFRCPPTKYGAGLPWRGLTRLQESFGAPAPESIQFERCEADMQP